MRAILFVLLLPTLCLASDWQPITGSDRLFYEAASLRRQGDVVTAWMKDAQYPKQKPTEVNGDCKKRSLYEAGGSYDVLPDSDAEKTLNTLCKRAWEIWK